jgi:integrase/recombinase XerD
MFIGQKKSGIYFIEFFDSTECRNRRISTGTKNKSQANKFFIDFQTNQSIPQNNNLISIKDYKSEYVKFIGSTYSKCYLRSVELSFKHFIKITGDTSIQKINNRLTQQFISEVYKRAPRAASLYLRTLKASFNRAIEWGYVSDNPFKKVKLPKCLKSFPVFITQNDLEMVLKKLNNQTLKDLFKLAFFTGMRLGEILNLKYSSVNLKDNIITVCNDQNFTTKNRKERVIPISSNIEGLLKKRISKVKVKSPDDFVFNKCVGIPLNPYYVSKCFKKAIRSAKLDDRIHFHSLRHSFASNLIQKGASLYVVKELLGHEDIKTTQIYSHLQKENLVSAIKLL